MARALTAYLKRESVPDRKALKILQEGGTEALLTPEALVAKAMAALEQ
jgi:hypothetical protein